MDSVRDLLIFFLKVAIGLFVIVLMIWLVSAIPKGETNTSGKASSTPRVDILPSPRKYSGFFSSSSTSARTVQPPLLVTPEAFVYQGGIAFSTSSVRTVAQGNAINSYTSNSPTYIQQAPAFSESSNTRNANIRNLSIYENGIVYTGLSFVGEARSSMFRDGKFPIVVLDQAGRVVGVSAAVAQTVWSVPGWVRFETRITYALPNKVPCTMIFEEALTQAEKTRQPLRVPLPIRCN